MPQTILKKASSPFKPVCWGLLRALFFVAAALTVTRGDRYASEGIDVTFLLMGLVCITPLLGIALSLNGLPIAPAVLALGWIAMLARER